MDIIFLLTNRVRLVKFNVKHVFLMIYVINVHLALLNYKVQMLELDFNVLSVNSLVFLAEIQ
jgi:hypothetical protein